MQSIEDILKLYRPADPELVQGPLAPEFKSILEGESVDRKEFDFHIANGDFAKAFESQAESASLHKSADFQEADAVLREFHETHDKRTLSEQLRPLITRAVSKLSEENAERLEKAWRALDLSIISFLLGKAFVS
jgi:hypothetical protein